LKIRIGTRGSDLALWQAHFVEGKLQALGHEVEITIIKTKGDKIQHLSFDKIEGKGFFTKEIEDALLRKEVDLAVHSFKDLETSNPAGLTIACMPQRVKVNDYLIIRKEAVNTSLDFDLKEGAIVGTSSARRKALINHWLPSATVKDLRGNVPTRINKLRDGNYDAIVLAAAGVDRLQLDLSDLHVHTCDPERFVPAPAQGALALQTRADDALLIKALEAMHDSKNMAAVYIEREILRLMEGGCHVPLGAWVCESEQGWRCKAFHQKDINTALRFADFDGKEDHIDHILQQLQS